MRQVVLDTETTGLDVEEGHRILEIGAVELDERRKLTGKEFHHYINPQRDIDEGALKVHGITSEFLADKPGFAEIWDELREFVQGRQVIMHNAPFDLAFLDQELRFLGLSSSSFKDYCHGVEDSLELARKEHSGQNNLDALCRRYGVDASQRELHGALLDATLLAEVYLRMTGGQADLGLNQEKENPSLVGATLSIDPSRPKLKVIKASAEETSAHEQKLDKLDQECEQGSLWRRLTSPP